MHTRNAGEDGRCRWGEIFIQVSVWEGIGNQKCQDSIAALRYPGLPKSTHCVKAIACRYIRTWFLFDLCVVSIDISAGLLSTVEEALRHVC